MKDWLEEDSDNKGTENARDFWITTIFNKVNNIATNKESDNSNWERNPNDSTKRLLEGIGKFFYIFWGSVFTKLWKESSLNRDANEVDWHTFKRGGLLVSTNSLLTHTRSEISIENTHNIIDALVGRASR